MCQTISEHPVPLHHSHFLEGRRKKNLVESTFTLFQMQYIAQGS